MISAPCYASRQRLLPGIRWAQLKTPGARGNKHQMASTQGCTVDRTWDISQDIVFSKVTLARPAENVDVDEDAIAESTIASGLGKLSLQVPSNEIQCQEPETQPSSWWTRWAYRSAPQQECQSELSQDKISVEHQKHVQSERAYSPRSNRTRRNVLPNVAGNSLLPARASAAFVPTTRMDKLAFSTTRKSGSLGLVTHCDCNTEVCDTACLTLLPHQARGILSTDVPALHTPSPYQDSNANGDSRFEYGGPAEFLESSTLKATNTTTESAIDTELALTSAADAVEFTLETDSQVATFCEPPYQPLVYHIPDDVLQYATRFQSHDKPMFWSYSLYRDSDGAQPTRHYCRTLEQSERVAQMFTEKTVLGFDIEWKSNYKGTDARKNVSMIQIAAEDRIAIFHLGLFKGETADELVPPSLRHIMESKAIIKAGVNIGGDRTRISKHLGIDMNYIFELSHLHHLLKHINVDVTLINRKLTNLAGLVEEHLYFPMNKDNTVRSSDWSKPLDMTQVEYAASDAYAGVMLYRVLDEKRRALDPVPPLPHPAELRLPIRWSTEEELVAPARSRIRTPRSPIFQNQDTTDTILHIPQVEDGPATNETIDGDNVCPGAGVPELPVEVQTRSWQPQDPVAATQLLLSEKWVTEFRNSTKDRKGRRAGPAQLRAYALWHEHALSATAIAALREPPLKCQTTASYVLECIMCEKLPFDDSRMDQLFNDVGEYLARARFGSVQRMRSRNNDL